jgi:threonine dehydratase
MAVILVEGTVSPGEFTSCDRGPVDDIPLVSEAAKLLLPRSKKRWWRAPAAGLALLAHPENLPERKSDWVPVVVAILTRACSPMLLRDLARSGRLAQFAITLQDPGSLYKVMSAFRWYHNVNIIEIYHQRHLPICPPRA